jgi:hypothetical protein
MGVANEAAHDCGATFAVDIQLVELLLVFCVEADSDHLARIVDSWAPAAAPLASRSGRF